MNIFALLVNPSQPHPLHPFPLPAMAFCQCIDPTCILWSKLAFDIYAGCQADGQRLKILPLLSLSPSWSWSPATALDHCHQREAGRAKGEREREGKGSLVHLCLLLSLVCSVFVFLCSFSLSLFSSKVCLQNYRYPGSLSGFGAAVSTFLAISVATETIQSSPANAPRRAFSFCYLCI